MYGKSKYVRRYARKGRGGKGRVARMAKGKVTSVQALAKSVQSIQRKMRTQHQILNYVQAQTQDNLTANYNAYNLCNYNAMVPTFGTDADDDNNYKIVHKSFGMDMYISLENLINNEEETITFTCFLVSLKDHIGPAFNQSTGVLSLTNGVHYYSQAGLTLLNKKCFNIHKVKRRVLTNHGTALTGPSAQTQGGTDFRFYWKWSPNQVIQNPAGDWKALSTALDPSKQYYLLIFNDNSAADLESPCITYNVVHSMKTIV